MSDLPSNQSTTITAGDNITIVFTETEGGYWDIEITGAAGSGGVAIQEEGVEVLAAAAALNFDGDDFDITDEGSDVAGINVATTHAGSTHSAAVDTHIADTTDVHDHGSLAGLADDDHSQYRLESADHTHQSTGLQAGQLDHGLALTGLTDDDHTQYLKESVMSEANATDLTDGGETALHSHAGAGVTVELQEEGVMVLDASVINFDGDDFDITDETGGVGGVNVAATHAGSTHSASTDTHIADAADAHDASAISADSTTLVGTGTDVQAVLEELDNGIADHLADTGDAHDASAISIADAGNDFTATDVEGALDELQADNEAHVAAADPHTGYRLESADHTHQSTGAQAGQLDHGLALTGLTDDDHTQYRLESADHTHQSTGAQAGTLDHGLALTGLTDDDHTQYLKESDVDAVEFSIGAFFDGNSSTLPTGQRPIWRAPFGATVTAVRAYADTGTTTVVNAGILGTGAFCSANITIDPADAWESGTVNQNTTLTADTSTVYVDIVTAGTATQITFQIEMTRDLSP